MGCRQAVRHSTLTAAFVGSNPATPAKFNSTPKGVLLNLVRGISVNKSNIQRCIMVNILFVCHGNICRSPMAEFVMKQMVQEKGFSHKFNIASAATSTEEIGNPVYPPVRRMLNEMGIDCSDKRAVQIKTSDYKIYDYIICMDSNNLRNIRRIIPNDPLNKIYRLMDFTNNPHDVADPWYTGDFDLTKRDIEEGCACLLNKLINQNFLK